MTMHITISPLVILHALYYMLVDLNSIGPKILNSCHNLGAYQDIYENKNTFGIATCCYVTYQAEYKSKIKSIIGSLTMI